MLWIPYVEVGFRFENHGNLWLVLIWYFLGLETKIIMVCVLQHTVQNCQETIKSKHLNHFHICCTVLWSKLRNARNFFFEICPFLQIAVEKMRLFKMHRIIKPTCPSRQLFKKITFAFMKIFDFLVKIAIFGAFLFRSRDSRHALLPETNARSWQ